MKISKKQLKQIIKEELIKESYDTQDEIYAITQHLSDASMKMGEMANYLQVDLDDARRAGQFERMSRDVAKINKSVETHIPAIEGGLRENDSYGNFNPSDGAFDDEQARLQSGASARRFEQDLDALVDDALDRGIPKENIAEILQMFAGSV